MKQHITESQWSELTDKQKQSWIDWKDRDIQSDERSITGIKAIVDDSDFCQIIDIGEMIEFLDDYSVISRIDRDYLWEVQVPVRKNGEVYAWRGINKEELCDALWEAVKEVLEREE